MQRRSLLRAAGATTALLAAPAFVRAQGTLQKFKFNVGWKFEATSAGFLLAQQRGYYKDAGLDVTIDTGNGSAARLVHVLKSLVPGQCLGGGACHTRHARHAACSTVGGEVLCED